MEVTEAIQTRRSVGRVTQDAIPDETVQRILESAVHAPNHKLTEPWEFHVFSGRGRGELAKARAELAAIQAEEEGDDEEMIPGRVSRERKKAFRAPVVIVVISKAGLGEVESLENYAACCCAVQNMQLSAHGMGLASMWRTGPVAYHPYMHDFFGLDEGDHVVAHLYIGHPDLDLRPRRREPVSQKTTWHGE